MTSKLFDTLFMDSVMDYLLSMANTFCRMYVIERKRFTPNLCPFYLKSFFPIWNYYWRYSKLKTEINVRLTS